jgi:Phd_YefM.
MTYYPVMIHDILAERCISISDLKKNPSAAIEAADGMPLAVLNRNTPAAYLVPRQGLGGADGAAGRHGARRDRPPAAEREPGTHQGAH